MSNHTKTPIYDVATYGSNFEIQKTEFNSKRTTHYATFTTLDVAKHATDKLNAHGDLVSALEAATGCLVRHGERHPEQHYGAVIAQCRAALAKARGES